MLTDLGKKLYPVKGNKRKLCKGSTAQQMANAATTSVYKANARRYASYSLRNCILPKADPKLKSNWTTKVGSLKNSFCLYLYPLFPPRGI
jgi:hypothetical protein